MSETTTVFKNADTSIDCNRVYKTRAGKKSYKSRKRHNNELPVTCPVCNRGRLFDALNNKKFAIYIPGQPGYENAEEEHKCPVKGCGLKIRTKLTSK